MESAVQTQAPAAQGLWQNRTFLALLSGGTISALGDGFHTVAVGLWVLEGTGSAQAMGVLMATRILVTTLLGSLSGVISDRLDRRWLMITADLSRTALVFLMAWLVATGRSSFWLLVLLTAVIAVFGVLSTPAFQASLIHVVGADRVAPAASLLQVGSTGAMILGPVLGGAVVATTSGAVAFTFDALTFLTSALLVLLFTRFPSPRTAGEGRSFLHDLIAGFRYTRERPVVLGLILCSPLVNFCTGVALVVGPVLALKVWNVDKVQYGAAQGLYPLGFMLGALLMMAVHKRLKPRGPWVIGTLTGVGAAMGITMLSPAFLTAIPGIIAIGVLLAIASILFQTTLRTEVPAEFQGRVFGFRDSLVNSATPLAMVLAGFLTDRIGPAAVGSGAGWLLMVVALSFLVTFPAIRRYR
jgi:MFS transporter, DHA3 family, macrolide efflux protein